MPYTPWDKSWDPVDGDVYLIPPAGDDYLCWFDVELERRMKWLTNAQCAAEYWRLKADLCGIGVVTDSPIEVNRKATIMHRFATMPHAFEEDMDG